MQMTGRDPEQFDIQAFNARGRLSLSALILGDGYANFGVVGALGLEFFLALLVGIYSQVLRVHGSSEVVIASLGVIPFFVLTQERGDVAMMNAGWMISMAVVVATYRLVGVRRVERSH
jgi:hypothetical protein